MITDKTNAKSVNLIMDQNINSDGTPAGLSRIYENGSNIYNCVQWISNEKYYEDVGGVIPDEVLNEGGCDEDGENCAKLDKGPLTAMNFLKEATKNWTNTKEMVINTYTDETGKSYKMEAFNTYARLPIYLNDETKTEVEDKKTDGSNAYLYDNLRSDGIDGYWTISSAPNDQFSNQAWIVRRDDLDTGSVVYGNPISDRYNRKGVRPVINLKI